MENETRTAVLPIFAALPVLSCDVSPFAVCRPVPNPFRDADADFVANCALLSKRAAHNGAAIWTLL